MASEFFKSNVVTGLAAGIGATVLAPVLLPMLARIAKPLTKSVIKTGMTVYEKGRESFAELSETVDDLVAEAKVELEAEAAPAAAQPELQRLLPSPAKRSPRPRRRRHPQPSPAKLVLMRAKKGAGSDGCVMAPLAREVHALPGRTRLRIDEKRGDEAYFTTVENALRDYPGILAVETNSRTASVLVHHTENDPSPWQRAEEQGFVPCPRK